MSFANHDTSVQGPSDKLSDEWDFRPKLRDPQLQETYPMFFSTFNISDSWTKLFKLFKIEQNYWCVCHWNFKRHSFISPWSSRKVKFFKTVILFMFNISTFFTKGTIKASWELKRKKGMVIWASILVSKCFLGCCQPWTTSNTWRKRRSHWERGASAQLASQVHILCCILETIFKVSMGTSTSPKKKEVTLQSTMS